MPARGRLRGHRRTAGRPDAGGLRGVRHARRAARPAERRTGVPVVEAAGPAGRGGVPRGHVQLVRRRRTLVHRRRSGAARGRRHRGRVRRRLEGWHVLRRPRRRARPRHGRRARAACAVRRPRRALDVHQLHGSAARRRLDRRPQRLRAVLEARLARGRPGHLRRAQRRRARRRDVQRGAPSAGRAADRRRAGDAGPIPPANRTTARIRRPTELAPEPSTPAISIE